MKKLSKLNIFLIVVLSSIVIILVAFFYYKTETNEIIREKHEFLNAVTNLKLEQVSNWKKGRTADAKFFATIGKFIKYTQYLNTNKNNAEAKEYFSKTLAQFIADGYDENIVITDTSGNILFTIDNELKRFDEKRLDEIKQCLSKNNVTFGNFYFNDDIKNIRLNIISIIKNNFGVPIGSFTQIIDPNKSLFPIVQKFPSISKSAETLIFKKEANHIVYLNELRHKKNSALNLTIPLSQTDIVAVKGVLGKSGIIEGKDYRGIDVLAELQPIKDTEWYMVSKIDKAELYAELLYRAGVISIIVLISILLIALTALYIYKQQQNRVYKNLFLKQKELAETQEEYKTALYSIGDGVITTDIEGRIKQMNPIAERITGWNEQEVKGLLLNRVFNIVNEETEEVCANPVELVLRDGHIISLANHTLLISKDGKKIPIADSGSPIKNDKNEIIGVVLVFRDQTEEREKEKALFESNEKFTKIFLHSSDSISLTHLSTGKLAEINEGFEKIFGYSRSEVIGKTTFELGLWADSSDRVKMIEQLKENGYIKNFEAVGNQKNGNQITALLSGEILVFNNDQYVLLSIKDISERKQFEESLKSSEEKYRMLLEFASDAFLQGDKDGNFITVNNKAVELTGYSKKELLGMNIKNLFLKENLETIPLRYDKLVAGETVKAERVVIKKDGNSIFIEMTSKQMPDGTYQSFMRDITEQKKTQKEFAASEEKFRKVFTTSPDSININRLSDGKYVSINNGFTKITGYTEEEVIGKTSAEIQIWGDISSRDELVQRLRSSNLVENFEAKFRLKNGRLFDGLMSASVIELNGEPHIISITRDISDRKRAEVEILKTKFHYQKLIENAPDGIVEVSADGEFKYVSPSAKKIFGYPVNERVKQNPNQLTHRDDLPFVITTINKIIQDPELIPTIEYRFKNATDNWIWIESTFTNLLAEPTVEAIVINFRDITERRKMEEAVRHSETKFYSLFENSPNAIFITDPETLLIIDCNANACSMNGYTREELIGKSINMLHPQDVSDLITNSKLHKEQIEILKQNKSVTIESIHKRKDGTIFPIESSISLISLSGKEVTMGIDRDITDRKQADEQLRTLSRAVEQSPAIIVITDTNGDIEFVNPKFTEITGYTSKEVVGRNPRILKSGSTTKEEYKTLWKSITAGLEWRGEFLNRKKNGELYWESAYISPLINERGKALNYIAVKEDISERKKIISDLVEAKAKADEMNRIKAFFFANMSHELRTPFVGIMGFSEILVSTLKDDAEREMAAQILKSSKRLTDTLNKILNVTRLEFDKVELSYKEFDVCQLLKNIQIFYSSSAKIKNTSISTVLQNEKIIFRSDPRLLEDILNNLVSNAVKFTDKGTIKLIANTIVEDNKKNLIIKVEDTGIGIPKDMQSVVWYEFRQASEGFNRSFEGSGLGLTISKKYVEILGGDISLESEVNVGSTFTIKLPISNVEIKTTEEKISSEKIIPRSAKPQNKKYKILYVEDDMIALNYISIVLKSLYEVNTAFTPKIALELMNASKYDAFMLDINLGRGMDGVELMRRIRQIDNYKTVPIVAVTAYAAQTDKEEFLAKGFTHYISKPFSSAELKNLLLEVFD